MKLSALKNNINMINMRMNSLGTLGKPGGFGAGGFTAATPDWKPPKKKKKTEKPDKKKSGKKKKAGGDGYDKNDTPSFTDEQQSVASQGAVGQSTARQGVVNRAMGQSTACQGVVNRAVGQQCMNRIGYAQSAPSSMNLQEAVLWAEILGEPVSKKRRRRRVSWQDGNQGNADRG